MFRQVMRLLSAVMSHSMRTLIQLGWRSTKDCSMTRRTYETNGTKTYDVTWDQDWMTSHFRQKGEKEGKGEEGGKGKRENGENGKEKNGKWEKRNEENGKGMLLKAMAMIAMATMVMEMIVVVMVMVVMVKVLKGLW